MNRTERRKRERRSFIVETAFDLFRKDGFGNVTMEKIAESSDITKATLYKYFSSKEAIVAAYWKTLVEQQTEELFCLIRRTPSTRQRIREIFMLTKSVFEAEPEYARIHFGYQFTLLAKNPSDISERSGFEELLKQLLEAGQTGGDIRSDIPSSEMAEYLLFQFTSACLTWFSQTGETSLEDKLDRVIELFMRGAHNEQ